MKIKSIIIASALLVTTSHQAVWAATACTYSNLAGTWEVLANDTSSNAVTRCKVIITNTSSYASGAATTCKAAYSNGESAQSESVALGTQRFEKTTVSSCSYKVTFTFNSSSATAYLTLGQDKNTMGGAWFLNGDASAGGAIFGTVIP